MDKLNEQIQSAYEQKILNPIIERRLMRSKLKWATIKKRLQALKRWRKKKPKKTKDAFDRKFFDKKSKTGGFRKKIKMLLKKIGLKEGLDYSAKIIALAQFKGVDPEEIKHLHYGGYEVDGEEYEVMTNDEANRVAREYIEDSVWAFNTWFLENYIDIEDVNTYFGFSDSYYDEDEDEEIEIGDADEVFFLHMGMGFTDWLEQEQQEAESANETIKNLIRNFDRFVDDAVSADGRGHFVSHYDGEENEERVNGAWYYIYRTN